MLLYLFYNLGLEVAPQAACPQHSNLKVMNANLKRTNSLEGAPLNPKSRICIEYAFNIPVV